MGGSFSKDNFRVYVRMLPDRCNMLINKHQNLIKADRRKVAQLLSNGEDESARFAAQGVMFKEKTVMAYRMIALAGQHLAQYVRNIVVAQRGCPEDLVETCANMIYAGNRLSEVTELTKISEQLHFKFGKEWVLSHMDNVSGRVNPVLISLFRQPSPSYDEMVDYLKLIASEFNIDWKPKDNNMDLQHLGAISPFPDPNASLSPYGGNPDNNSDAGLPGAPYNPTYNPASALPVSNAYISHDSTQFPMDNHSLAPSEPNHGSARVLSLEEQDEYFKYASNPQSTTTTTTTTSSSSASSSSNPSLLDLDINFDNSQSQSSQPPGPMGYDSPPPSYDSIMQDESSNPVHFPTTTTTTSTTSTTPPSSESYDPSEKLPPPSYNSSLPDNKDRMLQMQQNEYRHYQNNRLENEKSISNNNSVGEMEYDEDSFVNSLPDVPKKK